MKLDAKGEEQMMALADDLSALLQRVRARGWVGVETAQIHFLSEDLTRLAVQFAHAVARWGRAQQVALPAGTVKPSRLRVPMPAVRAPRRGRR